MFPLVDHLTQDHLGYVYWRGREVEHYSYDDPDRRQAAARALADRCLALEAKGFPVTSRTAIYDEFLEAPNDTPWLEAMQRYYAFFEKDGRVCIIFHRLSAPNAVVLEKEGEAVRRESFEWAHEAHDSLQKRGYSSLPFPSWRAYGEIAQLFERSRLTPEDIHQALI